jgi:hypothetical protein
MRIIMLLIVGLTFWTCKSSNDNFDPFDKDFSFHNQINIADYDSIFDDIDYWALQKNGSELDTYYLLYRPPYFFMPDRIVGKGFSLEIDRVPTPVCESSFNPDSPLYQKGRENVVEEIFKERPIDLKKIKSNLTDFGIANIKVISDTTLEIENLEGQIFTARIDWHCDFEKGEVLRVIHFMNQKDK